MSCRSIIHAAAAIAFAVTAYPLAAAVVVGPEVRSGVLANRTSVHYAAPAVAMARDAHGIAIAWSMREALSEESIFIARLDEAGEVSGAIERLARYSSVDRVALYPSMAPAPGGEGFVLAWVELEDLNSSRAKGAISVVDASLRQISTHSVTLSTAPFGAESLVSHPVVKSDPSGVTWVGINGRLWIIRGDGVPAKAGLDISPESDFAFPEGRPLFAERQRVAVERICPPTCKSSHAGLGPSCSCGILYRYRSTFNFIWLETLSFKLDFAQEIESGPAVESDGRDTLIVWASNPSAQGGDVVAVRLDTTSFARFADLAQTPSILGTFGSDDRPVYPDIASDGERFVVVWRTKTSGGDHDIAGALVERNGTVTSFPIATSVADERDPTVIAAGPGQFLVAYETLSGGERRIAGRFVSFNARRRAVR
ncbi:MAG: hypothetical protein JJE51_01580 [Thermoanaerobaculia bacterium]|nr:hypothetical protein [Thermoanaerobaculia bacterium]